MGRIYSVLICEEVDLLDQRNDMGDSQSKSLVKSQTIRRRHHYHLNQSFQSQKAGDYGNEDKIKPISKPENEQYVSVVFPTTCSTNSPTGTTAASVPTPGSR